MQELTFIIHVLAAAFLVVLILMQHGKGADMGAAFGSGASQTVFGSMGSVPFLIKVTAIIAVVFFATSIGLGYFISKTNKPESSISVIPTSTTMPVTSQPLQTAPKIPEAPKKQ